MAACTDLLVIGAGPYAYSAASFAQDNGIDTHLVAERMSRAARAMREESDAVAQQVEAR